MTCYDVRERFPVVRRAIMTVVAWACVPLGSNLVIAQSPEIQVQPGDSPQQAVDRAPAGSRIVLLPGLHQHPLGRHQAILYIDKPIEIELQRGAVLKLADHQTKLKTEAEITVDHGAPKRLDDLSTRGVYDGAHGRTYFAIAIDSEALTDAQNSKSSEAPTAPPATGVDTFRWARIGSEVGLHDPFPHQRVPITGDWQPLSNGVEIKFESTRGHNKNSLWILSFGGPESYGIRIGRGTHRDYIDNVRVFGEGVIDMNQTHNVQPTEWVKDISACVLIHGRVRNVTIEEITMRDVMRSVMAYGEHTGRMLRGGATHGGESFDAEHIVIRHTKTLNPTGKAFLLGHPSHRGRLTHVQCNGNYMVTAGTALEPNFNLDQYQVVGNVIKSGTLAIHCWRKSTNGLIAHNIRVDDRPNVEVVRANSPSAWEDPQNLTLRDNHVVPDLQPETSP